MGEKFFQQNVVHCFVGIKTNIPHHYLTLRCAN